jgi:hypothetical protein
VNGAAEFVAALVWMALIGAWFWHQRWSTAALDRQGLGLCARCGERSLSPAPPTVALAQTMCSKCLALTRRTYRVGAWFFYSLAALFALGGAFVVVSEFRRFGTPPGLADFGLLVAMTALPAGAGHYIHRAAVRLR